MEAAAATIDNTATFDLPAPRIREQEEIRLHCRGAYHPVHPILPGCSSHRHGPLRMAEGWRSDSPHAQSTTSTASKPRTWPGR
jgi:hypothetical protein